MFRRCIFLGGSATSRQTVGLSVLRTQNASASLCAAIREERIINAKIATLHAKLKVEQLAMQRRKEVRTMLAKLRTMEKEAMLLARKPKVSRVGRAAR